MKIFAFLVAVAAAMLINQPLPPIVTMANQLTAILGFGPIALIRHFLWTRISFKSAKSALVGLLVGLVMAALSILALLVALTAPGPA